MARALNRRLPRRPSPQRFRVGSGRGSHAAGITFTNALVTSAVAALAVLTITFDQPVSLTGTPEYTTDVAGADVLSAVKTADNVIEVTFDASVAAATQLYIPQQDPAVRTSTGGWASSGQFPV